MIYYCALFACFILYLRAITMYKLLGAYIRSGNLTKGFHITSLAGLYLEGIYLIVVNLNPTETENERVESCARVAGNRYYGRKVLLAAIIRII